MNALDKANAQQRAASDPEISAFVAASAGSGKTKLLTDRLLRLMLAGTRPDRILCLTYTKAAAAEMTIRLSRRLGEWVAIPEPRLDAQLQALGVAATPESRQRARKLFADVLDLPGGMRISTIHAFCQSLLRRFPVEAGLSPHFMLEDEQDAASRLREAREQVLAGRGNRAAIAAIAALAGETDEQAFVGLIRSLNAGQNDLHALLREFKAEGIAAMQSAALNAASHAHEDILRAGLQWEREHHLQAAIRRILGAGTPTGRAWAQRRLLWFTHDHENRFLKWLDYAGEYFTKAGERRKLGVITGKGLTTEEAQLHAEIAFEQDRIEAIQERCNAARLAGLNRHLLELVAPILQNDATARADRANVTYGELISMTAGLLKDPGAAWILYKLDGGIDHLLLDEVQDTAPAQWKIAEAIAEEFFSGQGAATQKRSIFAVGDSKQSIFSFQGADLHSFETYRARFGKRVRDAGETWLDGELSVSFRSTAPILALTDAVFNAGLAGEGVAPPDTLTHGVSRLGQAGSVTLWPLCELEAAPEPPAWSVPDHYTRERSAKSVLARDIAQHIQALLHQKHRLQSRARDLSPGDILILVRHRDELVFAITRELKIRNIPVAGADRIVLTESQAVSDLLALCDCLLLPEDDLAFAQFLVSPLGGLSDDSLMALAIGRHVPLFVTLARRCVEREDWRIAFEFFDTLRGRADYISPYALLAEALGPLGGRAGLLARLGPEAGEQIDELLAEALAFTRREPVSLQNFVFWLRQSGAEIKREAEAGGDIVRIMTVHGAKGLQAPLVILPDTTGLPNARETLFWLTPPQQPGTTIPIFCPRVELRSAAVREAVEQNKAAQMEEHNRLLYVALTRAEDELIICGAKPGKSLNGACWYESVRLGFERLEIQPGEDGRRCLATPQRADPDRVTQLADWIAMPAIPDWAGGPPYWAATPPETETTRPEPLAPSRNTEDAARRAVIASPFGQNPGRLQAREAAMAKGRIVHALLQHLPDLAPAQRGQAAQNYLGFAAAELALEDRSAIARSVVEILDDPELRMLFGTESRAEAPITGVVGDVEIGGLIDRLAVGQTEILVADYKTDRLPPDRADAIPPAYLRQLSAYRALLQQIYPAHRVICVLIWTETAAKMVVPGDLLDAHAPTLAQPYAA